MTRCSHPPESATTLFRARDPMTRDEFAVVECRACGFVVTSPAPPSMERYYPAAYYGSAGRQRTPRWARAAQRMLYLRRASAVERLAGGRGRVLDVGCGPGWLLDAFRASGWEVCGTELSERSAAHARRVLGLDVRVGPDALATFADASLDAVTCWHVLEHLASPIEAVRAAHRVLREDGVLMIGVPNFGGVEARLARAGWFHLDVPRHLTHFTPASISSLLDRAGFDLRRTSFVAPEFDAFSFVQSALNALGFRQNLLYDVLRGGAGAASPGATAQAAASVALAAPLGLAGAVVTAVLALARSGSSVTVLATKRRR